jgi:two-component system, NarL family, response regulator DesR
VPPIRVLLVDDEPIFLAALGALLARDERLEVVASTERGDDALELAGRVHPDVALVDLAMPGSDGFETTRRLIRDSPNLKVIVVSGVTDGRARDDALAAGARGFLFKGGLHGEIAEAIVDVMH